MQANKPGVNFCPDPIPAGAKLLEIETHPAYISGDIIEIVPENEANAYTIGAHLGTGGGITIATVHNRQDAENIETIINFILSHS